MQLKFNLFILIFLAGSTTTFSQQKDIDTKVEDLLKKMTLAEKVGQMNQYNGFWDATGPTPKNGDAKKKYDHLAKGWVGSMLNIQGVENVRKIQKIAVEESRLGIPVLFSFDVIHGHKTIAPIPLAEAASWDLAAIKKSAEVAATEAAAMGISCTFAPMVDITRDARWGRVMEGAGEDTYLGSKIAAARVEGFQGDDLSATHTVAATVKHFAGYGFAEAGRDYNTVDVGLSTLYNVILPPFKAAVDSDVKSVMNSFNILNGIPATGDKFLQRDILKDKWGFDGFVISDWGSGVEMMAHGYARDLAHVAELSANAGSDMDMESYAYIGHLEKLVKDGQVKMEVIDDAVRRILKVKYELGLFDDPYLYCDAEREKQLVGNEAHHTAVLDMAKKSIVLLKNENSLLPLKKEQQKIAVIGTLATDKDSPLGSWRLAAEKNSAVSVMEGLQKYSSNISYAAGPQNFVGESNFFFDVVVNETDTTGMAAAVALAQQSEVVLMVLGEHGFQSGEGRSRAYIGLPGLQQQFLEAVHAVNPNIVLVLMNGRPLTIPWAADHIPAIIETWQLGSQTGHAIAQTLFGDYNPSGKLPMTFPRTVGQLPLYYNHYVTGRPDKKDVVFWTHYSDEVNEPLYPFGHGLSYTNFKYSNLKIDDSDPKRIQVTVDVKNTGSVAGEEVTQLYIQDVVATVARPVKELKDFSKYSLASGASKTVRFTLTDKELGFFNNQHEFVVEPGRFKVMVGTSSAETLDGEFVKK